MQPCLGKGKKEDYGRSVSDFLTCLEHFLSLVFLGDLLVAFCIDFFFFFLTASPWATVSFPSCEWFCKNLQRGGKNEKYISTEGNLKASLMNRRRTLTRFLAAQISLSLPIHSERRRCAMKTSVVAVSSGVFQSGTPAWAAMEPKHNRWRFATRWFTKHQNTLKENCIVPYKTVSVVSRLHPSCLQVPLWPCVNQTQTQDQLLFLFIYLFFWTGCGLIHLLCSHWSISNKLDLGVKLAWIWVEPIVWKKQHFFFYCGINILPVSIKLRLSQAEPSLGSRQKPILCGYQTISLRIVSAKTQF